MVQPKQPLEHKILQYMETHNTISLATISGTLPHAASVFYVNIGFELYFLSSSTSRHGENLMKDPTVSGTINEDYTNWLQIKGIQLEGTVEYIGTILNNARIVSAYIKKFPNVADFLVSPRQMGIEIARKVSKVKFYKIKPARILYLDNSVAFGHREELVINPNL